MSDESYQPKVYKTNGGDMLVVANGGTIKLEAGSLIVPASGAQAALVAAITAVAATQTASYVQADAQSVVDLAMANKAAINAILIALTNLGIIASE